MRWPLRRQRKPSQPVRSPGRVAVHHQHLYRRVGQVSVTGTRGDHEAAGPIDERRVAFHLQLQTAVHAYQNLGVGVTV